MHYKGWKAKSYTELHANGHSCVGFLPAWDVQYALHKAGLDNYLGITMDPEFGSVGFYGYYHSTLILTLFC